MALRLPTGVSRPTSRRWRSSALPTSALTHDDPVEEVFEDQIACADLVVLNKRDLLDDAGIAKALAAISGALPRSVKTIAVADGKVDAALLLGLGVGTEDDIANRRTHHDDEAEHDHDDFDSFVVPVGEIADPAALAARVARAGGKIRRAAGQGFCPVAGKPLRLLVQAVGARVTHQYDRPWSANEARDGPARGHWTERHSIAPQSLARLLE